MWFPRSPFGQVINNLIQINSTVTGLDKSVKLLSFTFSFIACFSPKFRADPGETMTKSLDKLASTFNFHRYILRFVTGVPMSIEGAVNNSWAQAPTDLPCGGVSKCENAIVNFIDKSMPYSMLAYMPLEYVAFIYWTAPLLFKDNSTPSLKDGGFASRLLGLSDKTFNFPDTGNIFSSASCVAWLWYILGDCVVQGERVVRLTKEVENYERRKNCEECNSSRISEKSLDKSVDSVEPLLSSEETKVVEALYDDLFNSRVLLLRELLYIVPCLHWCNPNFGKRPLIGKKVENVLMFSEAALTMWQAWRAVNK